MRKPDYKYYCKSKAPLTWMLPTPIQETINDIKKLTHEIIGQLLSLPKNLIYTYSLINKHAHYWQKLQLISYFVISSISAILYYITTKLLSNILNLIQIHLNTQGIQLIIFPVYQLAILRIILSISSSITQWIEDSLFTIVRSQILKKFFNNHFSPTVNKEDKEGEKDINTSQALEDSTLYIIRWGTIIGQYMFVTIIKISLFSYALFLIYPKLLLFTSAYALFVSAIILSLSNKSKDFIGTQISLNASLRSFIDRIIRKDKTTTIGDVSSNLDDADKNSYSLAKWNASIELCRRLGSAFSEPIILLIIPALLTGNTVPIGTILLALTSLKTIISKSLSFFSNYTYFNKLDQNITRVKRVFKEHRFDKNPAIKSSEFSPKRSNCHSNIATGSDDKKTTPDHLARP